MMAALHHPDRRRRTLTVEAARVLWARLEAERREPVQLALWPHVGLHGHRSDARARRSRSVRTAGFITRRQAR